MKIRNYFITKKIWEGSLVKNSITLIKSFKKYSHNVKCLKFDNLDIRKNHKISVIKIDAEMYEEKIIRGMQNTLNNHSPLLLIELENRYSKKIT